jgi:UDP-N-acetylglucosamine 2-epimerase (non-hydrolysing)
MCILGTRPEAIKLAPVARAAEAFGSFVEMIVVSTAQHRELVDDVLGTFDVEPHEDLDLMVPGQTLHEVAARVVAGVGEVITRHRPDVVLVQGDTTTTMAGALAAYYAECRVAHVEAGLRTGSKSAPFPEEGNRCMTSCLADLHFAPTEDARDNLLAEGYLPSDIYVTGNTVIDALLQTADRVAGRPCPIPELESSLRNGRQMVLVTGHRRESFGEGLRRICSALLEVARARPDVRLVYPVHPNPRVAGPVQDLLGSQENVSLVSPQSYPDFVWLMQRSDVIVTDSGGIQEEAPVLGKPVLVTRRVTERPEAVEAGFCRLVGDDPVEIVEGVQRLLDSAHSVEAGRAARSIYGDGRSSQRILETLLSRLHEGWAGSNVVPLPSRPVATPDTMVRLRQGKPNVES